MTPAPSDLSESLAWRYATKKFDTRRLPEATWAALLEALVQAPSSFGLQPWRFVVVEDPAVRARLRPVSWGQSQVTDASHLVVLARRREMTEADINRHVARILSVRGLPAEKLEPYRQMMLDYVVKARDATAQREWAARQCYIALGQLMTAAAVLRVDTCALEGIDPAKYDEILGLGAEGYETVVACAVGYRAADDAYAAAAKVRFPAAEVVRTV
jgi:nitroreductase